jgi:hypothetical protein
MDEEETLHTKDQELQATHPLKKQVIISVIILIFLILGTIAVVLYGTGYRLGVKQGRPLVSRTGILVANSQPKGAQVSIDGHLTTATDTTINLTPGNYTIKISRDGYFPWEKKLRVEEKVVTEAYALLFPIAPKLESISSTGVQNPVVDPSRTKIAYNVSSQSSRKNGIYIYDLSTNPVMQLQGSARQIVDDTADIFSKALVSWSPDGQEILATIAAMPGRNQTTYALNPQSFNDTPRDVTAVLDITRQAWKKQDDEHQKARFYSLRKEVRSLIKNNFSILSWSPDDTKILYEASTSSELPFMIKPRLLGVTNAITEDRNIKQGSIYVYNIKEDVNVRLFDKLPPCDDPEQTSCESPVLWFPDSDHLVVIADKKIDVMDHDGSNRTTVYAGPFMNQYAFPWPDGSRIVILTNLNNQASTPNLYTISLK